MATLGRRPPFRGVPAFLVRHPPEASSFRDLEVPSDTRQHKHELHQFDIYQITQLPVKRIYRAIVSVLLNCEPKRIQARSRLGSVSLRRVSFPAILKSRYTRPEEGQFLHICREEDVPRLLLEVTHFEPTARPGAELIHKLMLVRN